MSSEEAAVTSMWGTHVFPTAKGTMPPSATPTRVFAYSDHRVNHEKSVIPENKIWACQPGWLLVQHCEAHVCFPPLRAQCLLPRQLPGFSAFQINGGKMKNPLFPTSSPFRVFRGGCWSDLARSTSIGVSHRRRYFDSSRFFLHDDLGFRLFRTLEKR